MNVYDVAPPLLFPNPLNPAGISPVPIGAVNAIQCMPSCVEALS